MNLKTVRLIASALLFIAIFDLPYGYFIFLRIFICILACLSAYTASEYKNKTWVWIFGITAILFNPIIPIYLDKEIWTVLDILAAILFAVSVKQIKTIEEDSTC
ncbi:hypothetical protein KJ688_07790 [bacterium]|nr:hypothetical protein [bacterium]